MSNKEKDIDSEFLELSAKLTKAEKKNINNQIADERVKQDGTVRKLGNIAERAVSILGGTGNNIPYVSSVDSQRFIELAKQELENMLEDVVNELDLSEAMIEEHGQHGTAPAELVRLVLEQKDRQIAMLKAGMKQIECA